MRLATCNEPWRTEPIENVFQIASEIGFDGVEVAPFTLADDVREVPASRRKQIARAAADHGLEIVGLHWLLVSPKGLHLTTPDDSVRQKTAEYIRALVHFCADLGGKVMIHGSPQQRNIEPPTTFEEGWKRARDLFASVASTCAERGVTICIEALAPKETNFINTAAEAAKLADEIGDPHIDIMLDMKAMASMPDGILETTRQFGARAKHFHVNEPSGKGIGMALDPGEGQNVDMAPVLKALADTGFAGWVSVEPFDYKPDPTTVARTAFGTLQAAMPR